MDQPTAEDALKEMNALVGEWTMQATPPGGEPWPGEARVTFEWMEGAPFLIQRWSVEMPEAPDGTAILGCDAADGRYFQLYSDERSVCRVYEMSIGDGEWKLWRQGEPFAQRFTGAISEDGNSIIGRWEIAEDGADYRTDFDVAYTKIRVRE